MEMETAEILTKEKRDADQKTKIAQEALARISDNWAMMTESMTDAQVDKVREKMNTSLMQQSEIRSVERRMAEEQPLGVYAQLTARFMTLYCEMIRMAVLDVRFGTRRKR